VSDVAESPVAAPTVSVVLPTYRRPDLLERAVASVLTQTYGDWELLVIDDNGLGTPEQAATEAALRAFTADPRVVYVPQAQNRGACAARNAGIHAARGRYVAFLDDDDAWFVDKLERQVACFAASEPDVALVYGGFRRVSEEGPGEVVRPDGRAHRWRDLLMRNGIGTTSLVMCRRTALLEVGGFDDQLPSMQDFDLYIRLAQRFPFGYVEEPLLDKHRHAGATIGKDSAGILRANEVFYAKHRALFEADRGVHHQRLRWFAFQALRAGRIGQARRLFWSAWRLRPADLATLGLAVVISRPTLAAYLALRRRRPAGAAPRPPKGA